MIGATPTLEPPAPGHSARRAVAELAFVLTVNASVIVLGALFQSNAAQKLEHPLLSALLTGCFMLLPVVLVLQRDSGWRRSLAVERAPLLPTMLAGGLGIAGAYAVNLVVTVPVVLLGGDLAKQLAAKASWMAKLAHLPAIAIVPLALFAGVWEEIVFRGFILGRLRGALSGLAPRTRDVIAVAVSAVLFGLGHGYQGVLGLVQTAAVGAALAALVLWRRSLWPAVIAHAGIDLFGLVALKVLRPMLERLSHGGGV